MAETVIILGAGASADAKAPLMKGFLERAWDLLATGELGAAEAQAFGLVRKAVAKLQLAHSKGDLDIWNVESVFDAFEMAALCGHLDDMPPDEVERLPSAMRQVIITTLAESIRLDVGQGTGRHCSRPPRGYVALVEAILERHRLRRNYPAVITFNYDVCLDFALAHRGITFEYCHSGPSTGKSLRLLKLHGSVSWGRCGKRKVITSADPKTIADGADDCTRTAVEDKETKCRLPFGRPPTCGCCDPQPEAMVVPPTLSKGQYHQALKHVWSQAALELSDAKEIFVSGYSLPESDLFFRYLYAVGTIGDALLRRVWVFNPDWETVKPRFERLLGKQVLGQPQRFGFSYLIFEQVPWAAILTGRATSIAGAV